MNGLDMSFLLKKIRSDDAYVVIADKKILRTSGFNQKNISENEKNWLENFSPEGRFKEYRSEDIFIAGKRIKLHVNIEEIDYYLFVFDDGSVNNSLFYELSELAKEVVKNPEQNLTIYYQPRFSYRSQGVKLEALLRVRNSNISTGEFIKVVEMEGLGGALDYWVFNTVIKDIKKIKELGFKGVSINLLPSSISDEIAQVLAHTEQIDRDFIEIELTEYSKLVQEGIHILESIKKMGFKLALDDFGSGFSNFDYLKKNIFDVVKLDQSWVALVREDPEKIELLKHLVSFLRIAKADIVLEGIEFKQDLDIVAQIAPEEVQGYIYSRPMPLNELAPINLQNMIPAHNLTGMHYAEV